MLYLLRVGTAGGDSDAKICERHPGHMQKYYCDDCSVSICDECIEQTGCKLHRRSPVAAVAERMRQDIDTSFTGASTLISEKKAELESRLRALSDEKDRALLCIDSAFEAHVHTLGRRATLLKNKVIDIYNENSNGLETGLEEVDTAMTCVVSLRDFHEAAVDRGDFDSVLVSRGTAEIDEVARNIADRVRPPEIHIVFDSDHGIEKFRSCSKDLGRVLGNRSAPRPPDVTPTNPVSPLASVSLETDIVPAPNRLLGENVVLEAGEFTGDGELYHQFENIKLSHDPSSDTFPVGQMYVGSVSASAAGEMMEKLMADGIPELCGSGDPSMVASISPSKMAGRPTCMVTNNNYFSQPSQLGIAGCKYAPDVVNINTAKMQSRTCTSYDEHRLRQELGASANSEDAAFCMSRSDYWPHGTCAEMIVNDNGEQGNVIVELSGEQTTL